jgi:hypothetical protein
VPSQKNIVTVSLTDAKNILFNDIPSQQADELAAQLVPKSLGVYSSIATHAAWKDIPSTYLTGDLDESAFSQPMVEMMIQGAQQVVPSAFDVVEHCKEGGHCMMISSPEWTADALREGGWVKSLSSAPGVTFALENGHVQLPIED